MCVSVSMHVYVHNNNNIMTLCICALGCKLLYKIAYNVMPEL